MALPRQHAQLDISRRRGSATRCYGARAGGCTQTRAHAPHCTIKLQQRLTSFLFSRPARCAAPSRPRAPCGPVPPLLRPVPIAMRAGRP